VQCHTRNGRTQLATNGDSESSVIPSAINDTELATEQTTKLSTEQTTQLTTDLTAEQTTELTT
jgi:hypothetical protein